MNDSTLLSIQCYDGDVHRVAMLMPLHEAHQVPIIVLSSEDRPVKNLGGHICRIAGRSGYIGQHTLDRQLAQLQILLEYPFDWFLLHDSDSVCLSPHFPLRLYESQDVVWSNEVPEPRPHASPYPKIAMQAPYFLSRYALEKIVSVASTIKAHFITPYIDWMMLASVCEAGIRHEPFVRLESPNDGSFDGMGNREWLQARVQYFGAVMLHPIKTEEELELVIKARKFYEKART